MTEFFTRYRSEIETGLRDCLTQEPGIYRMMCYHLGFEDEAGDPCCEGGGKALRPTLCLFACEALGGNPQTALPAALAVELIHNFSLIHDDIQDDDRERRHRPTVWAIWGKPQAINAGDAMHTLAVQVLLRLSQAGVEPQRVLEAIRILTRATLEMIEGQHLDLGYEGRLGVTVNDYLDMVSRKTEALITCALELGALLSCDDPETIRAFRRCGEHLGLAFQFRDDLLGIWGDVEHTGKPTANDILRRKKTLPVVYALEQATGAVREELIQHYGGRMDQQVAHAVISILERLDAYTYVQRMAEMECQRALKALDEVPLPSWAEREMEKLTDFLLSRER
ncbi:MAG: polyprenyl synthetase family protein [Candidatus Bipolaricaulia bacterium]